MGLSTLRMSEIILQKNRNSLILMYTFIQIHGTEDIKPADRERRHLIRKVAMIKAGKARKLKTASSRPLPRNPIVSLPIHPILLKIRRPQLLHADPGSGRRDPFTAYPIQMSLRMHEIIGQLYDDPKKYFCGFRYFWLPVALEDPAAFHQLLSNVTLAASRFIGCPKGSKEESLAHHGAAITNIVSRLSVASKEQAPNLVLPILALAQHANMSGDSTKFEVHFSALQKIIQLGGGLENMTLEPYTRFLLVFVEVNARARKDSLPLIPLPTDLLATFQINLATFNEITKMDFISSSPLSILFLKGVDSFAQVVCHARNIGQVINKDYQLQGDKLWMDARISGFHICVILHRLLSLQFQSLGSSNVIQSLRDATRISIILGLAAVRRRFLAFQVFTDVHLKKLMDLLHSLLPNILSHHHSSETILFWQLFMGGMEATDFVDWSWFAVGISMLSSRLEVESWETAMAILQSIFWINPVHSSKGRALWDASRNLMTIL
ncbi:hypothetical protein V8C35DRAFT_311961 [Trichoderma chlorosporum]